MQNPNQLPGQEPAVGSPRLGSPIDSGAGSPSTAGMAFPPRGRGPPPSRGSGFISGVSAPGSGPQRNPPVQFVPNPNFGTSTDQGNAPVPVASTSVGSGFISGVSAPGSGPQRNPPVQFVPNPNFGTSTDQGNAPVPVASTSVGSGFISGVSAPGSDPQRNPPVQFVPHPNFGTSTDTGGAVPSSGSVAGPPPAAFRGGPPRGGPPPTGVAGGPPRGGAFGGPPRGPTGGVGVGMGRGGPPTAMGGVAGGAGGGPPTGPIGGGAGGPPTGPIGGGVAGGPPTGPIGGGVAGGPPTGPIGGVAGGPPTGPIGGVTGGGPPTGPIGGVAGGPPTGPIGGVAGGPPTGPIGGGAGGPPRGGMSGPPRGPPLGATGPPRGPPMGGQLPSMGTVPLTGPTAQSMTSMAGTSAGGPSKPSSSATFTFTGGASSDPLPRPPYETLEVLPLESTRNVLSEKSSHPNFVRTTLNVVPQTAGLLTKCQIPLGLIIKPFAGPPLNKNKVPVIDNGASGIIRCRKCRTYINPFVQFVEGGRRWRCNNCNTVQDVPGPYFSPVDSNGVREDLESRPELMEGTVEYIAPQEYMVRPPQAPLFIFLIDVSRQAVASGLVRVIAAAILASLDVMAQGGRTRVAFITFNSTVHFYRMAPESSAAQMMVVSDVNDVFIPAPADLMVSLDRVRSQVEDLLNHLPTMFENSADGESALWPAVQAAFMMAEPVGAKVAVFQSGKPTRGAGAIKRMAELGVAGTDKETAYMQPSNESYKTLAVDGSRAQVAFDLFAVQLGNTFLDLASTSQLSKHTSGNVFFYPSYQPDRDAGKFAADITGNLTRTLGFEAVMRVRCSPGIKVATFHGHHFIRSSDLLALPNVDSSHTFACQMTIEDSLANTCKSNVVCFQTALLYTSFFGERRIRVHTIALPVSSTLSTIFASADAYAIATLLTKMAIDKGLSSKLADARTALVNKTTDIVLAFRNGCVQGAPPKALILPQSLSLLPLFVVGVLKSPIFCAEALASLDARSHALILGKLFTVPSFVAYVYPRVFKLYPNTVIPEPSDPVTMPPLVPAGSEFMSRDAIVLLDNGQELILWFGPESPPEYVDLLMGTSLYNISENACELAPPRNGLGVYVAAVVSQIRTEREVFMPLRILHDRHPLRNAFIAAMVEDRTTSVMGYYEFMSSLMSAK